jgi:pre-mRNA-splicing factor ATP-dependent RNA helicase DHX15/PRP43
VEPVTNLCPFARLLDFATLYYDLKTFPDGETKRSLQRVVNKKYGLPAGSSDGKRSKSSSKSGTPARQDPDGRDSKRRKTGS